MPGALFLCSAIFLYGWGALDLVRLAVAAAMHVVVGWVYLFASPFCMPRHPLAVVKANPFA
jgi:CHASE2 domain-containing sensor protein